MEGVRYSSAVAALLLALGMASASLPAGAQQQDGGAVAPADVTEDPAKVRRIQRALSQAGYDPGEIDGRWGSRTRAALRNFQEAEGLEATGDVDLSTVIALGLDSTILDDGGRAEAEPALPSRRRPSRLRPPPTEEAEPAPTATAQPEEVEPAPTTTAQSEEAEPAPAATAASFADFAGTWRSVELSAPADPVASGSTPGELGVTVAPEGDGFRMSWTQPEGDRVEASFAPTDRPGVYFVRPGGNPLLGLFFSPETGNPLKGERLLWSRVDGDTLVVYGLELRDDGNFDLRRHAWTLADGGDTLTLEFSRRSAGLTKEVLTGRLERTGE